MTTDLSETDVVMAGRRKALAARHSPGGGSCRPAAVFVYATCVTALIGDGMEAVCKAATNSGRAGDSGGTPPAYSTENLGNRLAGEAMFKYLIGARKPQPAAPPGRPAQPHVSLIGGSDIAGEFVGMSPAV